MTGYRKLNHNPVTTNWCVHIYPSSFRTRQRSVEKSIGGSRSKIKMWFCDVGIWNEKGHGLETNLNQIIKRFHQQPKQDISYQLMREWVILLLNVLAPYSLASVLFIWVSNKDVRSMRACSIVIWLTNRRLMLI